MGDTKRTYVIFTSTQNCQLICCFTLDHQLWKCKRVCKMTKHADTHWCCYLLPWLQAQEEQWNLRKENIIVCSQTIETFRSHNSQTTSAVHKCDRLCLLVRDWPAGVQAAHRDVKLCNHHRDTAGLAEPRQEPWWVTFQQTQDVLRKPLPFPAFPFVNADKIRQTLMQIFCFFPAEWPHSSFYL